MAVRVCARVGANRKTAKLKAKPVKKFAPTSMDCDKDLFTFREEDWQVSLATVQGRERVKLNAGNYQRGKLKGRKPTTSQLCKHRDGNFYLHIQLKDEAPKPTQSSNVIGVDFGRRDIAVTSVGESWDGQEIQQIRDRFSSFRASLQAKTSKDTTSTPRPARQILQPLSGRERRYQQWLNHQISVRIVQQARTLNAAIAVEDWTGIRERTNELPRNKTERRRSNGWAFFQLRLFISYKAIQADVEVIAVNLAYTSQTCHSCLHIHPVRGKSYRSGKSFKCGHCDWQGDADLKCALNIAALGRSVSSPQSPGMSCQLEGQLSLFPIAQI